MVRKRLRRVPVYEESFGPLLRGDRSVLTGLPDDAEIVDFYNDPARQIFFFTVHSTEFERVGEGEVIPRIDTESEKYETYELEIQDV